MEKFTMCNGRKPQNHITQIGLELLKKIDF